MRALKLGWVRPTATAPRTTLPSLATATNARNAGASATGPGETAEAGAGRSRRTS